MKQDTRLDKVEKMLTPKQAVVLWLQEIQQYRNAWEYVQFLRGQPESAAPIYRITKQIGETIRESMKGRPRDIVDNAVNRGVRDVCFLIKLQNQVNGYQSTEERVWSLTFAFLEADLRAVILEKGQKDRLNNLS